MFKKLKQKIIRAKTQSKQTQKMYIYCVFSGLPGFNEKTGDFADIKEHPPITFCATHDQASAAVRRLCYFKYIDHFRAWADKQIDERDKMTNTCTSPEAREEEKVFNGALWVLYFVQVRSELADAEFPIYCIPYSAEKIAFVLRLYNSKTCAPLYMPYEEPAELLNYVLQLSATSKMFQIDPAVSHAMDLDPHLRKEIADRLEEVGAVIIDSPSGETVDEDDEKDEEENGEEKEK